MLATSHIVNYTYNMRGYIHRFITDKMESRLRNMPVVAILGPRQCGKSTMAYHFLEKIPNSIILDLEKPSDLRALTDAEAFFLNNSDKLICIDEIQRKPELFPIIRYIVDKGKKNRQFLILGSASPNLIKQSSETLAGRISYLELTPFLYCELEKKTKISLLRDLWQKGGYPRSYLSNNIESFNWRLDFIKTFIERDIPGLGINISTELLRRLWTMFGHINGQTLNLSKLGKSLGVSHNTVRHYLDILTQTFMFRKLLPWESNLKKRLVKSPKIYFRDTGLLHCLLEIENQNQLMSHPVYGSSWESFALENIVSTIDNRWQISFYKTEKGAEIDCILKRGQTIIGIEFKVSSAPKVTRGFWNCIEDIKPDKVWIASPVENPYPLDSKKNIYVGSPFDIALDLNVTEDVAMKRLLARGREDDKENIIKVDYVIS